jgi:5-methylcytosine-specific restriction endonuclease McrA
VRGFATRVCPFDPDLEPEATEAWFLAQTGAYIDWRSPPRTFRAPVRLDVRIFDRDGWRCYFCGIETPRELLGKLVPNAPTLDHVMPICLGGFHEEENLACACRRCNSSKGGKHPLRYLRKKHRRSRCEVAVVLDISHHTVGRIERGHHRRMRQMMSALAEAYRDGALPSRITAASVKA